MKRIILSLLTFFAVVVSSCESRTIIPDEELALIFKDAFMANAYVYNMNVKFDTLQVYQPIFDRYGYTVDDVAYTVGSFSKRKSARLSDVVEQAIELLQVEADVYSHETMILDSIDAKALRAATEVFYHKDKITFYSLRDSADLRIKLDSLKPGSYKISYDYMVDSLDTNVSSYRTMSWVVKPGMETKAGLASTFLRKRVEGTHDRILNLDTMASGAIILLAESYEAKRKPHITFTDIKVDYTPPVDAAVDKLFKNKLDIRIFANDFFNLQPTDSLELPSL